MKKLRILGTGLALAIGALAFNSSSAGNYMLSSTADDAQFQQDTMHKRDTSWKHKKSPKDSTYKAKRKHDSTSVNR